MDVISLRKRPTYPVETRAWAVAQAKTGQYTQKDVARMVGCTDRQIRRWIKQADIDSGKKAGVTSSERRELNMLRRSVARLQEQVVLMEEARDFFAPETR